MARLLSRTTFSLSDLEAAYVACAIDTEGTIYHGLHKNPRSGTLSRVVLVNISNTDRNWIDYLQKLVPFTKVYVQSWEALSTTDCYRLVTTRKEDVLMLLRTIEPFLIIKRKKAQEAIEWIETRRTLTDYLHSPENELRLKEMRIRRWNLGKTEPSSSTAKLEKPN